MSQDAGGCSAYGILLSNLEFSEAQGFIEQLNAVAVLSMLTTSAARQNLNPNPGYGFLATKLTLHWRERHESCYRTYA